MKLLFEFEWVKTNFETFISARVRLLLKKGHSCYRPRRTGERKRKSVRGCIVDQNLSALALIVVKKGEGELEGLTDTQVPRRLGPKRASKIRKLFNLNKEDDVRQFVIKRPLPEKEGKRARVKAPKIQRLITPVVLQRKRHRLAIKKKRVEARKEAEAEYAKLIIQRRKEEKLRRRSRLSSLRDSKSSTGSVERKEKKAAKKEEKKETVKAKDLKAAKDAKVAEKKGDKKAEKKTDKKAEKKPEGKKAAAPDAKKKEAPKAVTKSATTAKKPDAKKAEPAKKPKKK